MQSHSGLKLLAENYVSSSDDSEDEETGKRKCHTEYTEEAKRIKREDNLEELDTTIVESHSSKQKTDISRLPLPQSINDMFANTVNYHQDDPTQHEGRTRSFKHEAGNWASFIYVSYEPKDSFCTFVKRILKLCSNSDIFLELIEDLHLSISKTVILRYHWIELLTIELQKRFSHFPKFLISLQSLDVYTNEEKTRTFIGLKAHAGYSELKSAVDIVDESFAEYKLPPFYKPPSFHVSIAWCNGDCYHKLIKLMPRMQEVCEDFMLKTAESRNIIVDNFKFKIGNKMYTLNLKK